MKKLRILSFLLIFLTISNIAYSYTPNNFSASSDNRIVVYKELNALRLKLSDGKILSYASLDTNINQKIKSNIQDLELIFVLDCSGSMKKERIAQLKIATTSLINKLYELLPEEKLKIGIIPFSTSPLTALSVDLTNDRELLNETVNSLSANGSTYISQALEMCPSKFSDSQESKKIVVTLTDGSVHDPYSVPTVLQNLLDNNIGIYSLFFDLEPQDCFTSVVSNENIFKAQSNPDNTDNTLYETMVNKLYDSIYSELVNLEKETKIPRALNASLLPGELILITLDDELSHGAVLEVEYLFTIKLQTDCKSLIIQDNLNPNFKFAQDSKLLTEDNNNSMNNWSFNNQTLTFSINDPSKLTRGSVIKKKLLLSKVIDFKNGENQFGNSATFQIVRKKRGEVFTGTSNTLDILVLPPFGKTRTYYYFLIPLLIFLLAIIIICIKKLKSKKNK